MFVIVDYYPGYCKKNFLFNCAVRSGDDWKKKYLQISTRMQVIYSA